MIYQQVTSAVKEAYAADPDVAVQAQKAASYRRWLQSLDIGPHLRDPLVEQARALEEAFADLERANS